MAGYSGWVLGTQFRAAIVLYAAAPIPLSREGVAIQGWIHDSIKGEQL